MNEKMTIIEASEYLTCTRQNVYNYVNKGYLTLHQDEHGRSFLLRDDVAYFKKASNNLNKMINLFLSGGNNV
jgi:excisionase family DNA binding protein